MMWISLCFLRCLQRFYNEPDKVAESMQGKTVDGWQIWRAKNAAITGSVVIEDQANYYNRMLFVFPFRRNTVYDKSIYSL
jgi:hypothetical protein